MNHGMKIFEFFLSKICQPHIKGFPCYYYGDFIKVGLPLNATVSKFEAYLVYYCGNDTNCSINEEKDQIQENTSFQFDIEISIPKISHQNSYFS
jgi:hypothetical protein